MVLIMTDTEFLHHASVFTLIDIATFISGTAANGSS